MHLFTSLHRLPSLFGAENTTWTQYLPTGFFSLWDTLSLQGRTTGRLLLFLSRLLIPSLAVIIEFFLSATETRSCAGHLLPLSQSNRAPKAVHCFEGKDFLTARVKKENAMPLD